MKWLLTGFAAAFALALPALAFAHAHPEKYSPAMGATVATAPTEVKIWFDADIEPLFDQLVVKDADGHVMTAGDVVVHTSKPATLAVLLNPALPAGEYRVHWQVAARDGHHSQGDYTFTVLPAK